MGEEYKRDIIGTSEAWTKSPLIIHDDFEDTFGWLGSGTGADWTVEKDNTFSFYKDFSLHIKTRITTPGASDNVKATRNCFNKPSGLVSYESSFYFSDDTNIKSFRFNASIYNYFGQQIIAWSYVPLDHKIYVLNDSLAWEDTGLALTGLEVDTWHNIKMMIDKNNLLYKWIIINETSINIEHISMFFFALGFKDRSFMEFQLYNDNSATCELWIDNFTAYNA